MYNQTGNQKYIYALKISLFCFLMMHSLIKKYSKNLNIQGFLFFLLY